MRAFGHHAFRGVPTFGRRQGLAPFRTEGDRIEDALVQAAHAVLRACAWTSTEKQIAPRERLPEDYTEG